MGDRGLVRSHPVVDGSREANRLALKIRMRTNDQQIERAYAAAKDRYASLAVDTDKDLEQLRAISISLQCWQGDDVCGFENAGQQLGGGLAVTGNYPGRARTADELRQDLGAALRLIPGRHRVNLHAMYAETDGRPVERAELKPQHFEAWIAWAKERKLGLDFNPTF